MKILFLKYLINLIVVGSLKNHKEKRKNFAQFLDMNVFEELYQIANEEIRELLY